MRNNGKSKFIITAFLVSFLLFMASGSALADTLGQSQKFFVNSNFDKYGRTTLNATLRYVSNKLYVYIEDSYWNNLNSIGQDRLIGNIKIMAEEFDNNIYSKETALFGSEPNPGIDGDPKITVLLEEVIKGNGGYFENSNFFSKDEISSSNEREMFVINVDSVLSAVDYAKVFFAHEFQHLISVNQKGFIYNVVEDTWLNELRSEYAVSVAGYNSLFDSSTLKVRINDFIKDPSNSLVEWPNNTEDYAIVNAFGQYLVDQYGPSIIFDTLKSKNIGIDSINKYLTDRGYDEEFEDIFKNWMIAVYLNSQSQNLKHGYTNPDLKFVRVNPSQKINLSNTFTEFGTFQYVKPWQPVWVEYNLSQLSGDKSKSLKLEINGEKGRSYPAAYISINNVGSYNFDVFNIKNGQGASYIINNGNINRVIVMATDGSKKTGFSSKEDSRALLIKGSIIDTATVETMQLRDGSLIKRPGEKEIYVIWGKYKRYLVPGVISLYGHLNPADAIKVEPEIFDSYKTSNYVKYINDERVYAVWPDGSKHWLNITPQHWDSTGRDWNAIFTINDLELNYYRTGEDIIR